MVFSDMNLQTAIATVAALDLPAPRRAHIIRELHDAPTTGMWSQIVAAAEYDARVAREVNQEALTALWSAHDAQTEREPAPEVSTPHSASQRFYPGERWPDARPVTVTYSTPTKPLAERKRAEGIAAPALPEPLEKSEPRKRGGRAKGEPRHGTPYAFEKRGCRCDVCVANYRATAPARYASRKAREARTATPQEAESQVQVTLSDK